MDYFICSSLNTLILSDKTLKRFPENHEYTGMRYDGAILTLQQGHQLTFGQHVNGMGLFIFIFPTG